MPSRHPDSAIFSLYASTCRPTTSPPCYAWFKDCGCAQATSHRPQRADRGGLRRRSQPWDLFQGNFFTRLQAGHRHRIDSSRQRILELLNLIMTQADAGALEARLKADAGLTISCCA